MVHVHVHQVGLKQGWDLDPRAITEYGNAMLKYAEEKQ